jgi:hypothetical protein
MSQRCSRCDRTIEMSGGVVAFCPYCGQALTSTLGSTEATTLPPVPATATEAPERLGEYRLLRRLGQGGMGVVYEAEHEPTGRHVAVKLIDVETSSDALERFRREGRLASTISHPRCVFVLAAEEEAGQPYIVMELMPGRTLDDLVRQRGPLPLDEALRHTLDLIDGLEQVHRLGLIHRDVKPSNCFLDADGRLKVGDFGLARALVSHAHLTRTGTFVGTPLFAAPEQIKGAPLDARADVYSVCATLYYLLTGRAPHDAGDGDALAAMARAVADEPPLLRTRRRDLPRSLERALERGLTRDRDRRWPDLAALRTALTGFQVVGANLGFLTRRLTGYLCDWFALEAGMSLLVWLLFPTYEEMLPAVARSLITTAILILYFGLWEGIWGLTPGRWLLGVRILRGDDRAAPGVWRGLWRALLFEGLFLYPSLVLVQATPENPQTVLLAIGLFVVALAVMVSPARRRNGFRCLHDLLSGTRVVPVPPVTVSLRVPASVSRGAQPADLPHRLGPFLIQDERWRHGDDRVLGSLDPSLERPVWLWLRPADHPALPEARRELFRATRLRWLAAGEQDGQRWDAFLAPAGAPLFDVVRCNGTLSWPAAREVLDALADELLQADRDGTLPESLSLSGVWLFPDGRVLLLDMPGAEGEPTAALDLLIEVALLLLEGDPTVHHLPRRPLPIHVRNLLLDMPRFGAEARDVEAFREYLNATRDQPVAVSRPLRLLHLAVLVGVQFLFCAGVIPLALSGAVMTVGTGERLAQARGVHQELDRVVAAHATGIVAPTVHLATRWPAVPLLQRDRNAQDRLRAAREQVAPYYQARREQMLLTRIGLRELPGEKDAMTPTPSTEPLDEEANTLRHQLDGLRRAPWGICLLCMITSGLALLVCLTSALLLRGGLRNEMFAIQLVRSDGRPPGRLRCAWRALAAWLWCIVPLAAARLFEELYWREWTPQGGPSWMLTAANVCWALTAVLVAVWFAVLMVNPARSLHDRLAGTWLVPF